MLAYPDLVHSAVGYVAPLVEASVAEEEVSEDVEEEVSAVVEEDAPSTKTSMPTTLVQIKAAYLVVRLAMVVDMIRSPVNR